MPALAFKNVWGAAGGNTDQQRSDLFAVTLKIPPAVQLAGAPSTAGLWDTEVAFAVAKWPFADRTQEMIPVKFLQQTNHQLGADAASGPTNVDVRYAFNRRSAELLERWKWLMSNPRNGGVAITSAVKATGRFYWLVPDMSEVVDIENPAAAVMFKGPSYHLEGVLVENLKPSDADMTQQGLVNLSFTLRIDRYYPFSPSDITAQQVANLIN